MVPAGYLKPQMVLCGGKEAASVRSAGLWEAPRAFSGVSQHQLVQGVVGSWLDVSHFLNSRESRELPAGLPLHRCPELLSVCSKTFPGKSRKTAAGKKDLGTTRAPRPGSEADPHTCPFPNLGTPGAGQGPRIPGVAPRDAEWGHLLRHGERETRPQPHG